MRWLNPLFLFGAVMALLERFASWCIESADQGFRRVRR